MTDFSRFSERDIAAMVVLRLMREGVMKRTPWHVQRVQQLFGLGSGDLVRAEQLLSESWMPDGDRPPSPVSLNAGSRGRSPSWNRDPSVRMCENEKCNQKVPSGRRDNFCSRACNDDQRYRDRRFAETGRSGEERRCSMCKADKPVEEFRFTKNGKNRDGSTRWKLKSFCIPCEQGYQSSRYMNVQVIEELNAIGIAYLAGDEEAQLRCADPACGLPILKDQRVVGQTQVTHWGCAIPEEATVTE